MVTVELTHGFARGGRFVKETQRIEVPNDWFTSMTKVLMAPQENRTLYVGEHIFNAFKSEVEKYRK